MNWRIFNLWFPFLMLGAGFVVGYILGKIPKLPTKKYPIVVTVCYESKNYFYTDYMECDSIKADTIWKDGFMIRNKNIKNIKFK